MSVVAISRNLYRTLRMALRLHFEKSRFYRPKQSQNRQSVDIARKRRSTARLQTDARPSRDGSERFGSGTQAYGQI